jgi:hypothetical protein
MTTLVPKFQQTGTGAVNRAFNLKLKDYVSVTDFGALGDNATDDTTAFNNAIATGKQVYVPAGTYLINATINNKTVIYGDGSTVSIVKPFNTAIAAMTYTFAAAQNPTYAYWTYHSEVRDLGFAGSAMVGIGFTFGTTVPANYAANMEYANNVKFYGCNFTGLNKGVQFPFGNIGSEFYSCGFSSNKYGVYTLNNKFGGLMHAGNKYFYAGEFHSNECAVYINNTAEGFGAISFTDTIFEQNNIATYCYNTAHMITPVSWTNVWFEANGAVTAHAATTIDLWTGTTLTTQTLTARTVILDGNIGQYTFDKSFFTDVNVIATNVTVLATNCRSEQSSGYNGGACTVASATSSIRLINPTTDGGMAQGDNITASGFITSQYIIAGNPSRASSSKFEVLPRSSKQTQYGKTLAAGVAFTSPETTSGSISITGTVVADGRIYSTCNEFTRAAFLSNEFAEINSSAITTSAGWYVYTFDVKVTAGAPLFYIWDRSATQFSIFMSAPTLNKWYSFASIGQSTGVGGLFLDVTGNGADCTWRLSAYQIHRFDSFNEAQAFLASNVYADTAVYTVAFLPAVATVPIGTRLAVSDATATTFASTVAGGGANKVPVYSDGTNWKIG